MKCLQQKMGKKRRLWSKSLPAPVTAYSYIGALMIGLAVPDQSSEVVVWILLAVAGGIVLIFILIAFFLLPLSRRTTQQKEQQSEVDRASQDTEIIAPITTVAGEETVPNMRPREEVGAATQPSLPIITSVSPPITYPVSGHRPAGIGWQIAGLTDVGLKRELNEDSLLMLEGKMADGGAYGLYVVADGLGGHEAGEVASRITVETIQRQHDQNPPAKNVSIENWLKEIIEVANESVLEYQDSHHEAQKMGSTVVMALVTGNQAHVANVGDSRAYHLASNGIKQISVDHSLVERLVQIGQISREEARTHKQRNVIYSIIGEKRKLEVGYYRLPLAPGDRLLLCSDGLSGMVTDEEMNKISQREPDIALASQRLVEAAKQAGGHDNISAILIEIDEAAED